MHAELTITKLKLNTLSCNYATRLKIFSQLNFKNAATCIAIISKAKIKNEVIESWDVKYTHKLIYLYICINALVKW